MEHSCNFLLIFLIYYFYNIDSNNKSQHFMIRIIMMMTMMKISIKRLWTNRSNQSFQKHKKIRNYNIKFDFFFFQLNY